MVNCHFSAFSILPAKAMIYMVDGYWICSSNDVIFNGRRDSDDDVDCVNPIKKNHSPVEKDLDGLCMYGTEFLRRLSGSIPLDGMVNLALEVLGFSEEDMKQMVYSNSLFSDVVTVMLKKRMTLYSFLHYLAQAASNSGGTINASVLSPFEKLSKREMENILEKDLLFRVMKEVSTLTWMKLLEKLQILSKTTEFSTQDAFYEMLCFWMKTKQTQHTCLTILQTCFTACIKGLLSKELYVELLMGKENCACTIKSDELNLLTTYQILELQQHDLKKIVKTVPNYLMGRFAVQLGMDLMTWEAWIELDDRSSHLRMIDRFVKSKNSYKELKSRPTLHKDLQPMLENTLPDWRKLLQLISSRCWASVIPYPSASETKTKSGRPERIRHMYQTMLEVMNGRTESLINKIADASDMLPPEYTAEVKKIIGRDDEDDSSSEMEILEESVTGEMKNIIPFDKTSEYFSSEDMKVKSTDTESAPFIEAHLSAKGEISDDLIRHLDATVDLKKRDYSLFGKKPTNNYKRLRKYLVDSMNASPKVWEPIGIAVIDSGCDEYLVKKRKVKCSTDYKNYIDNGVMQDTTGHGTLVTEIIHRYCGFIDVVFYHYIVSYSDGGSCRSDIVDALRTISKNDNIHIVNMSLQSDQYTTEYRNILDEVGRKKVVLAASGNDYYGGMRCVYPALHPMVIAVAGDGITFSAPVTEPFVHIRCPSFSCSSHFHPGTSFAVAHATALAAISLRYAEVVDDARKEQCCAKGLVLFRALSEMNFSKEHFKAIYDALGQNNNCYYTQTDKQQLENRCKIFEDILCAINQHNVDYYTASKILSEILSKILSKVANIIEDDLLEASSSSTAELCWIASEHIHDTTSFKREFSEQQRHFVCQEWSERHGAAPPHQTGYLTHLKDSKFNCYMSNKPAEDMCDAVCNMLSTEGFADAADYFKSMIDGPSRRSLLSNSEHMQQFFIDVIKRQQTGTPSQFVFIDSDICAALNMLKRKNYYSKEKPKSWAKSTMTIGLRIVLMFARKFRTLTALNMSPQV